MSSLLILLGVSAEKEYDNMYTLSLTDEQETQSYTRLQEKNRGRNRRQATIGS